MMKEKEKELMERYIYEVTRRLSREQRQEIGMELRELIEEMYESEQLTMEEVLTELGEPAEFAKRYRDGGGYLIGPEYFDNYSWILKLVLICVAGGTVIALIVSTITGDVWGADILSDIFGNLASSLLAAFGMVTLIFAIFERQKTKIEIKMGSWTPGQLDPVPDKKALISRGETVVGVIFLAVFGTLLIFAPQLIGAYVFDDGKLIRTIPIFNLEQWHMIFPILLIGIFIGLADEVIRLVAGTYNMAVMVSNIITGGIQIALAVVALRVLPFWNPNFVQDISKAFDFEVTAKGDILSYWNTGFFSNLVLGIICFATLLEVGTTVYRTLQYGGKR